MFKRRLSCMTLLMCFISPCAFAGWETGMMEAFNRIGIRSNMGGPGYMQSQQSGLAYGGAMSIRAPAEDYSLSSFELPSVRMGDQCAFDLFAGAFGHINADKALEMIQAIGANAATFAIQLALKQMAPQIQSLITEIQEKMDMLNFHNINACDAGKWVVNNAADRLGFNTQKNAEKTALDKDETGNVFEAQQIGKDQAKINALNKEASEDPERKNLTIAYTNIAWEVIQQNPSLAQLDKETKYLLMNLTGTIIIKPRKEGGRIVEDVIVSKLESSESDILSAFTDAVSKKVTLKLDVCKEDKQCLVLVKNKSVTVDASKTFFYHVKKQLTELREHIAKNKAYEKGSAKEKAMIAFVEKLRGTPIYSLARLEGTLGTQTGLTEHYAELASLELLLDYMNTSISAMQQAMGGHPFPKDQSERFLDMLASAKKTLEVIYRKGIQKTALLNSLTQQVDIYNRKVKEANSRRFGGTFKTMQQ